MTTPRTPEPSEPRPLSDREKRALHDLEARLVDDDPALSLSLRRPAPWREHLSNQALDVIIQVTVAVAVLVVVLPAPWGAAVVAVALMMVPGTLSILASRQEQRERRARGES